MLASEITRPPGAREPRSRTELILHEIDALPTLSAVAVRLLAATSDDESTAAEVTALIAQDPALSAMLLKLAGRADLGVRRDRLTVHQAVTLLGFRAVRNLVLTTHIHAALPSDDAEASSDTLRRDLWRHALAVACVAEELALRQPGTPWRGDAFLAGLLHDIGKIALEAAFPKSYARVVERVRQRRQGVCEAEQEVFGLDHTLAGKRLATRWKLPAALVETVWLHHFSADQLPAAQRFASLIALVHVADGWVRQLRVGFSGYRDGVPVEEEAARVGFPTEALREIAADLPERMAPLEELLGADAGEARKLYADSLHQANRELGALNAELIEANRRLADRSRFFDILNAFHAALAPDSTVDDVGRHAARALTAAGRVRSAFVVIPDSTGDCLYLAAAHDDAPALSRMLPFEADLTDGMPRGASGPVLLEPNAAVLRLWRTQVSEWPLPERMAAVAVPDDDRLAAVLLVSADDSLPRGNDGEWRALADALRLAVGRSLARRDAERRQEELYELSRRLHLTQRELVRARTISMIAEMAAGAAHEINNPLSVISGRAQLLRSSCSDSDTVQALSAIIDKAGEASQIVNELMNFAKPPAPQPVSQPLRPLLDTLCQHWRSRFALGDDEVEVSLADADVQVHADLGQLTEILDAVVHNAVQACDRRRRRIRINSPSFASDETVRIEVEDNGAGMSPQVVERAIDPFFSHRTAGRGRGLGLSRAYRLAGVNGGQLWIDSSPDAGTTVTIELPARPPSVPSATHPPTS